MIPLIYFLFAWLVLVAIFAVLALITVLMNVRFGLSGFVTYAMTAVFLGVVCLVLLSTGGYFLTVDWSQDVSLVPPSESVYEL